MSAFEQLRVVAAREVRERARTKAFVFSTLFLVVFISAAILVPALLTRRSGPQRFDVGVVETPPLLERTLRGLGPRLGGPVQVRTFADARDAERALREDDVDVVVVGDREVVVEDRLQAGSRGRLLGAVQQAVAIHRASRRSGLPPMELERLLRGDEVEVRELDRTDPGRLLGDVLLAQVSMFLIFGVVIGFSSYVLNGVIEEKASRVVELVISSVRPRVLLAGKILGHGLLALVQIAAILLPATALFGLVREGALPAPAGFGRALAAVVVWGLLGLAFYSSLFAAAGSLVSRMEEAQFVATPMMMVFFVGFVGAGAAMADPDGTTARVLSFVPPATPLVMAVRWIRGGVAAWELVASVAVMLGAIALVVAGAARVYAGAILHTVGRVRIRQAWRAGEGSAGEPIVIRPDDRRPTPASDRTRDRPGAAMALRSPWRIGLVAAVLAMSALLAVGRSGWDAGVWIRLGLAAGAAGYAAWLAVRSRRGSARP